MLSFCPTLKKAFYRFLGESSARPASYFRSAFRSAFHSVPAFIVALTSSVTFGLYQSMVIGHLILAIMSHMSRATASFFLFSTGAVAKQNLKERKRSIHEFQTSLREEEEREGERGGKGVGVGKRSGKEG